MNCISVMAGIRTIFCVVILIAAVVPLCMMPYRMFQASRDKVKLCVESGGQSYDLIFAWLAYGFVGIGVLFSLYTLGLVNRVLAIRLVCFAGCLWMFILLVCYAAVGVCAKMAKRRRTSQSAECRRHSQPGE